MTKWIFAAGAAVFSATALWFGTGLHPIWWITWLAPLPMFLVSPSMRAPSAFVIAAVAWFVGELNVWQYLHTVGVPPPVALASLLIPAAMFGLDVVLFRAFLKRGSVWRAALVAPTFWVAYEFLSASVSPHGTFFNLGYTQMDCLPVLQVVSLTGIWGISFCLFVAPATIAAVASKAGTAAGRKSLACAVVAALLAVVACGSWRLSSTPPAEHSVLVALVASDLYPKNRDAKTKLLQDYSEKAAALAVQGAQLVVLPEKIAVVSRDESAEWDAILGSTAARANATVIAGLDNGGATRRWNEARIYSTSGRVEAVYDKHHLLPGFEDVDQVGSKLVVVQRPSGFWGIEICKDMDFPELSRQYGAKGVALLLVPAWDFDVDGWLHGRMAVMRGVESGFTIVRSAKQGLLTVSDDRGRILAEQSSSAGPMGYIVAAAPVRHDDTVYLRYGDWFGWANVAGLLVILIPARRKRLEHWPQGLGHPDAAH
ncbi:MAG: nitrilase-related carbon-nitrogen hydrolase [Bryobacteraceae bacterium]